ncbi:unnamed protein product [Caenorhabditis auriculariae]|uniref:Uncharacterized protein n=1 Tax=Caenorhabditis auriculariae TaxID=2777116 RepID=A0A8S1HNX4_9PELO|nr:unnamed protein product [Caenorhabditis auriculariae]
MGSIESSLGYRLGLICGRFSLAPQLILLTYDLSHPPHPAHNVSCKFQDEDRRGFQLLGFVHHSASPSSLSSCQLIARHNKGSRKSSGGMYARLDEFDVLTPLTGSPASSGDQSFKKNYGSASSLEEPRRFQFPPLAIPPASDSPPPPRRSIHGRTLIVPLNTSRYRSPLNPAGTPDSRMTSLDGGTTKSCATIPEDDEDEIDALISIDRTSMSVSEPRSSRNNYSAYNLRLPQPMPEFQLPAPAYSPPSLPSGSPAKRPSSLNCALYAVESTASLCGESDVMSKYQLHRIEEESEGGEDGSRIGSQKAPSELSNHAPIQFVPRSISQQFELMRET